MTHSFIPQVEQLEERCCPYAVTDLRWPITDISFSFMPDGTMIPVSFNADGSANLQPSTLFATLDAVAPTEVWQRQYLRALQAWADVTPINFHQVADDGTEEGVLGPAQGDSRFGDIRFGMFAGTGFLGVTVFPSIRVAPDEDVSAKGDSFLSSLYPWAVGSTALFGPYDIYSVALHEDGHALGLGHSTADTVMAPFYHGLLSGLTPDDIAGIRAMYGIRQRDQFDSVALNNSKDEATPILPGTYAADLRNRTVDLDCYRLTATGDTLTVTVSADNSLLAPRTALWTLDGVRLGIVRTSVPGGRVVLTATGLSPGAQYIVVVGGGIPSPSVFNAGRYTLTIDFTTTGTVPPAPPQIPDWWWSWVADWVTDPNTPRYPTL